MKQKNMELLKEVGLTDGEIKIYLALINLGSSTTGNIVKKSKIHASKIYSILDRLIEKGLISFIKKDKKNLYTANPPSTINSYLNRKENELKELKDNAKEIIDELSKKAFSNITDATIYLGFKGLRTAHEKMYDKMKKGDILYYLGIPAYQPEEQHTYWMKDHKRRVEHGFKVKLLFNQDTDKKVLKNRNTFKGSDARYMPTPIKTPALFGIYKDVVLIMLQSPEVITVEITNTHIAESFKAYFHAFWKDSKPFRKK